MKDHPTLKKERQNKSDGFESKNQSNNPIFSINLLSHFNIIVLLKSKNLSKDKNDSLTDRPGNVCNKHNTKKRKTNEQKIYTPFFIKKNLVLVFIFYFVFTFLSFFLQNFVFKKQ